MQFNSYVYLLAFLPITICGYFIINKFNYSAAKIYLVIASSIFYAYSGINGFIWLLVSIFTNYIFIHILNKRNNKLILWLGISINVILLFYFKYTNFFITSLNDFYHTNIPKLNILLPIGISFFTFQQICYLIDTYQKQTNKNTFLDYLIYVTFFPKILMGPIVNQNELLPQFNDEKNRKISSENIIIGIRMFTIGLFKKVIISDTFAKAVTWAWGIGNFSKISSMDTFLVMIAYTFQIYFDFSGYSDMAIASASMLNINLPINFDSPYKSYSIRDFWKRWHISLTQFLTKYIYIPLGGNRKSKFITYINIMIVFMISGIWHGANYTFILWGFLHGALSIFDRLIDKLRYNIHPALQWITNFFVVSILWFLFRADSISQWKNAIMHILDFKNTSISSGLINSFIVPESSFIIDILHIHKFNNHIRGFWMLLFYLMAFIICLCFENSYKSKHKKSIITAIFYALLLVFTLTCITSESVFVYFNF